MKNQFQHDFEAYESSDHYQREADIMSFIEAAAQKVLVTQNIKTSGSILAQKITH